MPAATTDTEGFFRIEQLDSFQNYRLFAGGHGFVLCDEESPIFAIPAERRGDIVIEVCRSFGAVAVLDDARGGPIRVSNRLRNDSWISATGGPGHWVTVNSNSFKMTQLLDRFDVGFDDYVVPWVYADVDGTDPGTFAFHLDVDIPFYRQRNASIPLRFFDAGFEPTRVRLEPESSTPFGTVELEIRWPGWIDSVPVPRLARRGKTGAMPHDSLSSVAGGLVFGQEGATVAYRYLHAGETLVRENLPLGTYGVRFVGGDGWFAAPSCDEPPLRVDLAGDDARATLDLSDMSALRVVVRDVEGMGPAYAKLRYSNETSTERRYCESIGLLGSTSRYASTDRPKTLIGLGTGRYSIRAQMRDWKGTDLDALEPVSIQVPPGELVSATFERRFE